ncbi:leucyl aminopeptidase [Estrella lausannensis]|uniref:Probable cytosol aminopeptidase n=1 Tax=Estrella lausannensis TaxID=483423 RepID=A0A0H5DSF2_9BACT|nr:leucyl aminopeptidase [Estrella lausannensis]CRX39223.1 Leucyl aminopeptidase [Estrella lausannensis]
MIRHVTSEPSFAKRKARDLLLVPFWNKGSEAQAAFRDVKGVRWNDWGVLRDFKAKEGEAVLYYDHGFKEKRLLLVGLGKEQDATAETFRRAAASAYEKVKGLKIQSLSLLPPVHHKIPHNQVEEAFLEGMLLAAYPLKSHKTGRSRGDADQLSEIALIRSVLAKQEIDALQKLTGAVFYARDLVIGNADDVTPSYLAAKARETAREFASVTAKVLGRSALKREKMDLLLAVSRGSKLEPKLIVLEYRGNQKSTHRTAVIGKGITFDTGGLNLKPTGSIETQRGDMAGAAAALALIRALASLKIKTNVTVVIPSAENGIDSASYKPGDVYRSHSGKTVEIANTDAEGRLILADAISYAIEKFKPAQIIDLATLTGAIIVALGHELSGLFSNDDALAAALTNAGEKTYERVWRMPLPKEYRSSLDSDIADIANSGGRPGGSIKAALFLQEFIGDTPWAHLDIAGTAYLPSKQKYLPKQGTGVMVRLLTRFFQDEADSGSR